MIHPRRERGFVYVRISSNTFSSSICTEAVCTSDVQEQLPSIEEEIVSRHARLQAAVSVGANGCVTDVNTDYTCGCCKCENLELQDRKATQRSRTL